MSKKAPSPTAANIERELTELEKRHKRHQQMLDAHHEAKHERRARHRARHFERSVIPILYV